MSLMNIDRVLIIVLTIILRCGFILIHIGCIPTTNATNIYIAYLFNTGVSSLIFMILGSVLAIGGDWRGIVGVSCVADINMDEFIWVWSVGMYCSSIVQLVTAGRIHIAGDILATTIFNGIIYPVVYHGAWTENAWMRTIQNISKIPYQDVSGATVIHLFSSSFALGAMIIFGSRIININKLDHNSLAINAQVTSSIGYMFIIASTMGLMLQSPFISSTNLIQAQINCIIGVATGLTVTTLFYLPSKKTSYWTMIWIMQGGMASLVSLASAIDSYNRIMAFLYSFLGAVVYVILSIIIRTSGVEDYGNLISVHLIPGVLSSYLTSFNLEMINENISAISHKFFWQFVCSTIIFLFGILSSFIILMILLALRILRNKDEKKILRQMWHFERGCCQLLRTLDSSEANMINPGFHTFLKFKKRTTTETPHVNTSTPGKSEPV